MSLRQQAINEMKRRRIEAAKAEIDRRKQLQSQGQPQFKEEMHEDFTVGDRAFVKNFSQSPEVSAQYLKKQHPDLDIQVQDGRILAKRQDESQYKVLDPDAEGVFDGFGELAMDAGDILYDVGSGVVEGAALAGGTLTGTPVGGIAAAAGAGAVSEALRQGTGQAFGLDQNLGQAGEDVALSALISGAVPVLGKALKPAAKVAAKGAKKVVSGLTQATADDVGVFANKAGELDDILTSPSGFTDKFSTIIDDVTEASSAIKKDIGKMFEAAKKEGHTVDIDDAIGVYDDHIGRLAAKESAGTISGIERKELAAITKQRNEIFTGGVKKPGGLKEVIDPVTGVKSYGNGVVQLSKKRDIEDAMELRQVLANKADFSKTGLSKEIHSSTVSKGLAARGYGKLGKSIDAVSEHMGENKQLFKDHMDFMTNIVKHFKTPESLETFLKQVDKGSKKSIVEKVSKIDKVLGDGSKLADNIKLLSTADKLKSLGHGIKGERSLMELIGAGTGAKIAWATGNPWLIGATSAAGATIGSKLGSIKMARRYVNFIVKTEGMALGLDEGAKNALKKTLFKSVTGGDVLSQSVKQKLRDKIIEK